jgi:DNA-directed RNA polymerase subunit K/omega
VNALLGGAHQRASGAKQPDTGAPSDDIPVLVAAEEQPSGTVPA